jgi:hypothetical protein
MTMGCKNIQTLTFHSERSEESPSSGMEEIPRFARNDMQPGFIFKGG